ncbi:hypothetical protein ACNCOV_004552 [Escherichia coli]|uniref:hypothetical protein n=1 Tax=Escherichia coli TaxID=562 RepID=UPI001D183AB7|nr:hypothetical protein [Escherichia coli]MCC4152545.1 hypothetical protein [Escherichia coli]MDU9644677.1 hypothetical protein [Escherichia coli]
MFGTAKDIIEKLENYPEDEPLLMVMWHKEDVGEVRPDLTDEQCVQVLRKIKECHDTSVGGIGMSFLTRPTFCFQRRRHDAENHRIV